MSVLMINLNQIMLANSTDTNNNPKSRRSAQKCLFGAADPEDTKKLAQEEYKSQRERFFERFGIHMEDLEKVAVENSPKKKKASDKLKVSHEKSSRQSRVLKPYNVQNVQTKMTDFCQVKKAACNFTKKH